jgi:glycosyltransferase involved in cell wall biosynthesis
MNNLEKLKGAVALASNSPGMPTGYGNQGKQLGERMIRSGLKFAALSNYGLEGKKDVLELGGQKVPHYPKGLMPYSQDAIPVWTEDFASQHPELKTVLFTLYDVWVYNEMKYEGEIVSWVPLDHITPPPAVIEFLKKKNVTPVTMSPHGQQQLESVGIQSTYIPHGIDTKIYKPTPTIGGIPTREYMGVPEDTFLVGMVAANKANGQIHRKAFAENLLAFATFHKKYPNSQIYIHSEASRAYGGFNLAVLLKSVGLDKSAVLLPPQDTMRTGFADEEMAAFYTAFDVLLSTSYGEGFGIPTVEAQACGTRVITSNFAASKDLASEDSWKIDGQPFWDEAQGCFFQIPSVNRIQTALEEAYNNRRGHSDIAVEFAKQFDADHVWRWRWMPFLKEMFK